jgi:hypothetical protein
MRAPHVFKFTADEKVLGTEPGSGAEREMHPMNGGTSLRVNGCFRRERSREYGR